MTSVSRSALGSDSYVLITASTTNGVRRTLEGEKYSLSLPSIPDIWTHASSWEGGAFRFVEWAGGLVIGRRHSKTQRTHTEGQYVSSTLEAWVPPSSTPK